MLRSSIFYFSHTRRVCEFHKTTTLHTKSSRNDLFFRRHLSPEFGNSTGGSSRCFQLPRRRDDRREPALRSSAFPKRLLRNYTRDNPSRSSFAFHPVRAPREPIFHVLLLPFALLVFAPGECYGCGEREIKFLTIRTIPAPSVRPTG